MDSFMLYLVVALGTFMSYLFTPTFGDSEARVVFERLFFGRKKHSRKLELFLLLVNVFGGAGVAYILLEPNTPKLAMTAGLGWTSVASIARSTATLNGTSPPAKLPGNQKKEP